ncbi:U3 small nucleolar ribonucleoprotein protein MPP10 [Camponotus floridanus]|uniref:U3 small nucleolar ribonucleoprotein protein MPP10 n=1 Tax=Camponotus floridanus TaxID=104421 RepID=E2AYJ4_CAMFO|nr:U3 small nucleolar ribonucleoprotein protein MPP10 [Camponotus floridanus]EFN61529.1 U3 small nucleolar ribonucleoprotein protein MPP10 [Camponotus floridanus]
MASIYFFTDSIQSLERVKSEKTKVDFTDLTKRVYDFTKEQSCRNTNALPELVTEGFDEEQIWQQLELQNEEEITHLSNEISKVLDSNKKLMIPVSSMKPELMQIENDNLEQENEDISDDKESEGETERVQSNLRKRKYDKKKKKKSSVVDDKFFKLQELDEYLTKEEKKENQDENNTESDDESVDLFNNFSEEENEVNAEGKYIKYADFFDSPESENEQLENKNANRDDSINDSGEERLESEDEEMDDDEEDEEEHKIKRVRFNLTNDSDETDSLENKTNHNKKDKEEEEIEKDIGQKSTLEARQDRLLMRIKELEEEAIGEKPWQLKGEVSGPNRPQNSLLEEFVEIDVNIRPAPAITEETTMKLEDIIKQRIKDKAWDDVEKKFKPVETPLEYKKKLILDQEKSKESLSQIYEKEYLQQKQKQIDPENNEKKEEVSQLHSEIRQMMRFLMSKLDALSNYHYTPKMAKPEIKIISNVPAIRMEEVAPITASDATLLAPEEIKTKPRGDIIAKSERTKTDMKRERRRKKLKQRMQQQAIEKKEKLKALKPGISKKYEDKKERATLLKQITKDRNVTKLDETMHKVAKSSTAFFTQLQNQTKNKVKRKDSSKKKNNISSAVKLKL